MSKQGLEPELLKLIRRYIVDATQSAALLRRELMVDNLLRAVNERSIPREGRVGSAVSYQFHGVGCFVETYGVSVNFDFGPDGRTDGFDAWRLWYFARQFSEERDFHEEDTVRRVLSNLERAGVVVRPGWAPSPHLYYLTE